MHACGCTPRSGFCLPCTVPRCCPWARLFHNVQLTGSACSGACWRVLPGLGCLLWYPGITPATACVCPASSTTSAGSSQHGQPSAAGCSTGLSCLGLPPQAPACLEITAEEQQQERRQTPHALQLSAFRTGALSIGVPGVQESRHEAALACPSNEQQLSSVLLSLLLNGSMSGSGPAIMVPAVQHCSRLSRPTAGIGLARPACCNAEAGKPEAALLRRSSSCPLRRSSCGATRRCTPTRSPTPRALWPALWPRWHPNGRCAGTSPAGCTTVHAHHLLCMMHWPIVRLLSAPEVGDVRCACRLAAGGWLALFARGQAHCFTWGAVMMSVHQQSTEACAQAGGSVYNIVRSVC